MRKQQAVNERGQFHRREFMLVIPRTVDIFHFFAARALALPRFVTERIARFQEIDQVAFDGFTI